MGDRSSFGEFEELVMLAVAALTTNAYGLAIQELLAGEGIRTVGLATVHSALYRLEKKGLLKSELGGATKERGGRSKRLFRLTASGREMLVEKREARDQIWALIPDLKQI